MVKKAFTLIELLVVIAIIALLLSILLPGLSRAKAIARRVICSAHLRQVGVAVKMYFEASDEKLPDELEVGATSANDRWVHSYGVYRDSQRINGTLKPFRFAYLYELDYIDTPEIFYCPGNRLASWKYEYYTHPTPWGTLPQTANTVAAGANGNQWVRIGYTYFPLKEKARSPDDRAVKYNELNPNIPYTTDVLHHLDNLSHQHNKIYSVNAMFPDGHVTFCNDKDVFAHPVWGQFVNPYQDQYYTIFRMIHP